MPKVQAVIAGQPYRGSLMPMGDGTYCLGVLKSIQEAAGVKQGDTVTVELELDTARRVVELPADLAKAIAQDKKASAAWDKLSFTNKKEMARGLEEAKKPETRERRVGGGNAQPRGEGAVVGVVPGRPPDSSDGGEVPRARRANPRRTTRAPLL